MKGWTEPALEWFYPVMKGDARWRAFAVGKPVSPPRCDNRDRPWPALYPNLKRQNLKIKGGNRR